MPPRVSNKIVKQDLSKTYDEVPPLRSQNKSLLYSLTEKYNIETVNYMLEPWERYLLNITALCLISFLSYQGYALFNVAREFLMSM